MASIFISYSRKDTEFAQNLVAVLEQAQHKVWIDNKPDAIRVTAPWWDEIKKGILQADVFLLVLSQNSAFSAMCQLEIAEARRHNKKIVTAIIGQFSSIDYPGTIAKMSEEESKEYVTSRLEGRDLLDLVRDNWHFVSNIQGSEFVNPGDYTERYQRILTAIDTDLDYANYHSRLQQKAVEWIGAGRRPSLTLRGDNLKSAEEWLSATELALRSGAGPKHNPPTEEQIAFIRASRQVGNARQRVVISALTVGIVVASILALLAFWQSQVATTNAVRADANAATAVRRADESNSLALVASARLANLTNPDLALALAVEANQIKDPSALAQSVLSEYAYTGGQALAIFPENSGYVSSVAFSPDEKLAATGSSTGALRLWDVKTHQLVRELVGHQQVITALRFSPDGHYLLAAGGGQNDTKLNNGEVTLWEISTGQLIKRLVGHTGGVHSLDFTPDSKTALSAGTDGRLFLWDIPSGTQLGEIDPFPPISSLGRGFSAAVFTPDGKQILTTIRLSGHPALLWDVKTQKQVAELPLSIGEGCYRVAFQPDGKAFLCSQFTGDVRGLFLIDAETGATLKQFTGLQSFVFSMSLTLDGQRVLAGEENGIYQLWDVKSGSLLHTFFGGTGLSTAISPSGSYVLTLEKAGQTGAILWDATLRNGAMQFNYTARTAFSKLVISDGAYSPDARLLAVGVVDGVRLVDASDGTEIRSYAKSIAASVSKLAMLPDGNSALVGYSDGTVDRLDLTTGKSLWTAHDHHLTVNGVAVNKQGQVAVTGGEDGQVIVWDTQTGLAARHLDAYPYTVSGVGITDNGQTAAAVGCIEVATSNQCVKRELRVWDVPTGVLHYRRATGKSNGAALAFSHDGAMLAIAEADNSISLLTVADNTLLRKLNGHTASVESASFSPDDRALISGGWDETLILWDIASGGAQRKLVTDYVVSGLSFSPDGHQALSVGYFSDTKLTGGRLTTWRIDRSLDDLLSWTYRNRTVHEFTCAERQVYNLTPTCGDAVSSLPTRTPFPTQTMTATLDVQSATPIPTRIPIVSATPSPVPIVATIRASERAPFARVWTAFWSPDGKRFLTSMGDGTVRVWDAQSAAQVQQFNEPDFPRGRWSPDGKRIATANLNNAAHIWDAGTGQLLATLSGHTKPIHGLSWSKDGTRILTGSDDGSARVWDAANGKMLLLLNKHTEAITDVRWSPDEKRIATSSEDGTAFVLDALTGEVLFTLVGHKQTDTQKIANQPLEIIAVSWSPDGSQIMTGANQGTAILWDATTGKPIFTLDTQVDTDFISGGYWTRDTSRLLLWGLGSLTVWDTHSGKLIYKLMGHEDLIVQPSWSPDETQILTASFDGTVRVWDAQSGKQIRMMNYKANVNWVSWSPDGTQILSTGDDGTVRLWDARTGVEKALMFPPAEQIAESRITPVLRSLDATLAAFETAVQSELEDDTPQAAKPGDNGGKYTKQGIRHRKYSGVKGELISLRLQSLTAAAIRITTLDGRELARQTGTGDIQMQHFTLPADGTYLIEITGKVPNEDYVLTITSDRVAATPG